MRIKMIKLANSGPMIIGKEVHKADREINLLNPMICLLYTSDAADD